MIQEEPLSRISLLQKFDQEQLGLDLVPNQQWKQLLSDFTILNIKKRNHLQSLKQQIKYEPKYKLIILEENVITDRDYLEKVDSQLEVIKDNTIMVQETEQLYFEECGNLKQGIITLSKKIADIKQLLNKINIQAIDAKKNGFYAKKQYIYFHNEVLKGNHLIDSEQIYLDDQLDEVREQQQLQKQDVQVYYRTYAINQKNLQNRSEKLASVQKTISKLDYEQELKRLAKSNSQQLLIELEEVKIVSQAFLGQGIMEKNLIDQLSSQEFWFSSGRQLILNNIGRIPYNNSNEMSLLPALLNVKTSLVLEQQFSLNLFLSKLSDFFTFCDNDVQSVITQLIQIHKFEVQTYEIIKTIYEVSLRNRYDDLNQKRQLIALDEKVYDLQLIQLEQEQKEFKKHSNFVLVIEGNLEQISENSLNSMEFHQNNNQKERTSKAQKVIWRLLTFLTNGLYRWIDMIKTFSQLVSKDDELIQLCQSTDLQTVELFSCSVVNSRTQSIILLLDQAFSKIGQNNKMMDQQKEIIFTFIKNDFILFNFGSLKSLEIMLSVKIQQFKIYCIDDEDSQQCELIKGLSTYICLEFKDLAHEAFTNFQKLFITLLNRFIKIFSGLQKSAKKTQKPLKFLVPPQQRQLIKDRKDAMIPNHKIEPVLFDEEKKSTSFLLKQKNVASVKGLFGQNLEFKKQTIVRKCQQYQYYFDEKGGPQAKKTMMDAMYETIFNLESGVVEDPLSQEREEQHFKDNYLSTRQNIVDQQQSNIDKLRELEKLKEQKEFIQVKNYQEKSRRSTIQEQQMSSLVKLGEKIRSKIFIQDKKSDKDKLDIVQALHRNYTSFRSQRQSRFKIQSPNSYQDLPKSSRFFSQILDTNNVTNEGTQSNSIQEIAQKKPKLKLNIPEIRLVKTTINSEMMSPRISQVTSVSLNTKISSMSNSIIRLERLNHQSLSSQRNDLT